MARGRRGLCRRHGHGEEQRVFRRFFSRWVRQRRAVAGPFAPATGERRAGLGGAERGGRRVGNRRGVSAFRPHVDGLCRLDGRAHRALSLEGVFRLGRRDGYVGRERGRLALQGSLGLVQQRMGSAPRRVVAVLAHGRGALLRARRGHDPALAGRRYLPLSPVATLHGRRLFPPQHGPLWRRAVRFAHLHRQLDGLLLLERRRAGAGGLARGRGIFSALPLERGPALQLQLALHRQRAAGLALPVRVDRRGELYASR